MSLASYSVPAILVGLGATVVVDLWTLLLKHVFKIASLSYCLVGRWILYMPKGVFSHPGIAAVPALPSECAIGWIAHYVIGAAFGLLFVSLVSADWLTQPTLPPALMYGIGTVLLPFLVMQPSLGFGIAASKSPNPQQARLKSIVTHAVFGFGLYAAAIGRL